MVPQNTTPDTPSRDIRVPLHAGPICGDPNPRSGLRCRRADGHTGRCAWFWLHLIPGRVREVWAHAYCQLCQAATAPTEGAVCRKCGG